MVIVDTDVLVWALRGGPAAAAAADAIERIDARSVSIVTYMELLQGARNRRHARAIKDFLIDASLTLLPLTENIGHRAAVYMEEHALSGGLKMADALIGATAVEYNLPLFTGNLRHFRLIAGLDVRVFRP